MENGKQESENFKGIWIPKDVWFDERLNLISKIYLSLYKQYFNNEQKTDLIILKVISDNTLNNAKKILKKYNLLEEIIDSEMAKNRVLLNKGQGKSCEWCGCRTYALQKHHYPIPKHKNGKETVLICPNCHYEYHLIVKDKE